MIKIDKKLFKQICEVQTVTSETDRMSLFLYDWLDSKGFNYTFDKYGNIFVNPELERVPCMVAHIDTVHDIVDDLTVFSAGNIWTGFDKTTMRQSGIGGDDKVGIYITLELLTLHNMKAAFFVDEEAGCLGSGACDLKFFKDCKYILQCDRKGNKDFITSIGGNKLSSATFISDVKKIIYGYGYDFCAGLITDVGELTDRKVGISTANISCGYYNPHQASEYINLDDVANCMNMCSDIFENLISSYPHINKYQKPKYSDNWYGSGSFNAKDVVKRYYGNGASSWGAYNYRTKKYDYDVIPASSHNEKAVYSEDHKDFIIFKSINNDNKQKDFFGDGDGI